MTKTKNNYNGGLSVAGFFWRFVGALVLVLGTFNPSGHSGYHWIATAVAESRFGPTQLIVFALLAIGWVVFMIATLRALGTLGVALAVLLLGGIIWLLFDIGLLQSHSASAITWIALVCLAGVLAVGMSWSHIWRRLTGQVNVEDVDD